VPTALRERSKKDNDVEVQDLGKSSDVGVKGANRADKGMILRQTAIFSWKDVVYDIKIKKEERRILDHIEGWVKPGTLTALMVSQA